jgi:hypothetical protein
MDRTRWTLDALRQAVIGFLDQFAGDSQDLLRADGSPRETAGFSG